MSEKDASFWRRQYEREKTARKEAESLLESKSLELYNTNQDLKDLYKNLERRVQLRASQLERLTREFLSFGLDPSENINQLTKCAGELLGADCAIYNRILENKLSTYGVWNPSKNYSFTDNPDGQISFDVINGKLKSPFLVRDLQNTTYASTDPNVQANKLETYLGYPVIAEGETLGVLNCIYSHDFAPSPEDHYLGLLIKDWVLRLRSRS